MSGMVVVLHFNRGLCLTAVDQQLGLYELGGKRNSQRGGNQQTNESETAGAKCHCSKANRSAAAYRSQDEQSAAVLQA